MLHLITRPGKTITRESKFWKQWLVRLIHLLNKTTRTPLSCLWVNCLSTHFRNSMFAWKWKNSQSILVFVLSWHNRGIWLFLCNSHLATLTSPLGLITSKHPCLLTFTKSFSNLGNTMRVHLLMLASFCQQWHEMVKVLLASNLQITPAHVT